MTEEIHKIVIQGEDASARRAFRNIKTGADSLKRDLSSVARSTDNLGTSMRNLVRAGAGLLGISLGAHIVRDAAQLADQWTLVDARIRNSTKGQAAYQEASAELLEIAKRTNSEFESVATLFTRTNQFIEANGGSQRDTLKLVELVAQAAKVSGAGVQEQQASVRQLSQAMASGVLRGDEFNSVMENSPRLAQALADGLHVPVGALREMAEQGKLTANVVTKALLGQADKIAEEFAKIPLTVGAAFTNLKTATGEFINQFDKANGTTRGLAEGINDLAQNLPALTETFKQLLSLGIPAYMLKVAASTDLVALAFKRFLPAAIALAALTEVLKLLTAINTERLRQQDMAKQRVADEVELGNLRIFLGTQIKSVDQYEAMTQAARNFYKQEIQQAVQAAEIKLRLNAGKNEPEALEAARQLRLYRENFNAIAEADRLRSKAMQQSSEEVIRYKQLELRTLDTIFKAEKAQLKAAEQALDAARDRRKSIIQEFTELKDSLKTAQQGEVLQFQVEKAVSDARAAQELSAKAPASEADRLANAAIEKARSAGELLKTFKDQQLEKGSPIDTANAESVSKRLSDDLLKIADDAAAVQEKIAADQVATLQKSIQDILTQAEVLKSIEVGFDKEGAARNMDELLAMVQQKAEVAPIRIPAVIVSSALPNSVGELKDLPAKAQGGPIFGPGGPTSDSILAKLSNNEHVLTAREVAAAGGHSAIYRLRRMILSGNLPKFANGGAVSRVAIPSLPTASLSASGGANTTINLTLPGMGTYRMQAAQDVASTLQRDLSLEALKYGGRR